MDLEENVKEDPYEQKLYFLFNSHCEKGFLNKIQLQKLCSTLQLNASKSGILVELLTTDKKCDQITFHQFREGLLKIITAEESSSASTQPQSVKNSNSDDDHSDREISPKLVVGTKKYGRRSRPSPQNNEELVEETSDSDNNEIMDQDSNKKSSKVQRSASQSDVHGAKRRRPMYASKLKRCASLPSHKTRIDVKMRQQQFLEEITGNMPESKKSYNALARNLRAVWDSFETNNKDVIDFSQLEIVCEKVGLHKIAAKLAAEEIYEKLSIQRNDGISFNDFMNLLQSDSDMFSSVENVSAAPLIDNGCNIEPGKSAHTKNDDDAYQTTASVWSTENGSLTNEAIVELWEAAGINDADKLLSNLGFYGKDIQITELGNILEEEIQRTANNDMDLMPLIKATISLYKAELTSLKQVFRQVVEENRKLFSDNKEANRRASILAHEIDERHTNLEDSTRSEIQSLESRHSEMIKELSMQLSNEREQLTNLNAKLEMKIKTQEVEEQKLRNDILNLQNDNSALESEQTELHKQITELLEQNIKLNQEIAEMEQNEEGGKSDLHNEEVLDLIEKIETLQMENSNLRDKNDELCSDLENANMELMKLKNKSQKVNKNSADTSVEQVDAEQMSSLAVKRRGDSPSKARMSEESPRLGKVRKFSSDVEAENEGEWIALNSELGQLKPQKFEEELTKISEKKREEEIEQLRRQVQELEKKVQEYNEKNLTESKTANVPEPAEALSSEKLAALRKEKDTLAARVAELEQCLEQMSSEYENCEDYWQGKLNEERLLFDEEQRISDEKFAELLQKMAELEEQFSSNEKNGRLTPIDEKCQLESQYLELENEMEELKVHAQSLLDEKTIEIENLKKEVVNLKEKLTEAESVKTPPRAITPGESIASSPINYLWNQNTITGPIRDYQNPNFFSKRNEEPEKLLNDFDNQPDPRVISPIQKPVSNNPQPAGQSQTNAETNRDILEVCEALSVISNRSVGSLHDIQKSLPQSRSSSPINAAQAMEDIKKLKIFKEHLKEDIKELSSQRESLVMELQQLQEAKPILAKAYRANHPNLNQKIQNLEQKNRHLQSVLKQQQQYAETIMHQTWQQQRAELNELRNRLEAQSIVIAEQAQRLASADLLVKDLYVENSHLSASLQRMEQQLTRNNFMQMTHQAHHQQQHLGSLTGMP